MGMGEERPAVERLNAPKGVYRVINRAVVAVLSSPRAPRPLGERLLLLHVTGRRTGREFSIPVAHHFGPEGERVVLTSAPWRVNLRELTQVEVTYLGERRPARAELVEDPAAVALVYRDLIEKLGPGRAGRQMGIRINVDRVPTLEELEDAVRRDGFSVIRLTLEG